MFFKKFFVASSFCGGLFKNGFASVIDSMIGVDNFKSDLFSGSKMMKQMTIHYQYLFSILVYVVIVHGYYKASYYPLMHLTIVSMSTVVFYSIFRWNKPLSARQASVLFIYIPIVNIFSKDIFFLLVKNIEIKTIFLHTHFLLLLFISLGGLVAHRRNVLYVCCLSVIWVWVFTILINDSYLWSLVFLDTLIFIGTSLVIYRIYLLSSIFYFKLKESLSNVHQQNEELNRLINLKDWMLNMIVHDVKIPISRVLSSCEMDIIQKSEIVPPSRQILEMVESILDVYKMEESKIFLKLSNQNIETIINEASEQVQYFLDDKRISIKKIFTSNLIVEVDVRLLVRVFVNILINSVKFSRPNSVVEILTIPTDNKVRVEILDTGVGIAPENIDNIFEKYFQADDRSIGNTRSTGIGLAFCKLVINSHGGTIGAESKLNHGTKIWFELPLAAECELVCEKMFHVPLDEYEFDREDKELLEYYKSRLVDMAIYATGEIIDVFDDLPENCSISLLKWKEDVVKSSITGNKIFFDRLMSV